MNTHTHMHARIHYLVYQSLLLESARLCVWAGLLACVPVSVWYQTKCRYLLSTSLNIFTLYIPGRAAENSSSGLPNCTW